ncbi:MATH and LRR domain-containing protein PFE0570w-like isoform X2 [Pieris brassicae]|uniref:MATH and LRR domain-containing protein PFE0570w-like isoform X2 n=1 Tax=Pieris brassicae TaxID=7116 RepID=UPI001E66152B|nr:MATH and LRR domain-containing protein PFE0570w-like isoform X2 [Pieris brassicae]
MDKRVLLIFAFLALLGLAQCDDTYKQQASEIDEFKHRDLKCMPGRTVIKIEQPSNKTYYSEEEYEEMRRSHMSTGVKDETCQICVCSVEGKDEYCSQRPAKNINECLRLALIREDMAKGLPYAHDRTLAYRIRRVGDKADEEKCVPFVSQYSDCSDENMCGGCTRCSCTAEGKWSCEEVFDCNDLDDNDDKTNTITDTINVLFSEVKERQRKMKEKRKLHQFAPPPPKSEFDSLIVPDEFPYEETFEKFMDRNERYKRSIDTVSVKSLENETVKFHNTVDEINEDTLKNSNKTGTIEARKVNGKALSTRRKNVGYDKTELSSLHIEYNQPQDYEHHIAENKIDSPPHSNDKSNLSNKEQILKIMGNYSQATKDQNLSKIVVNELKKGKEIIGDKNAIPMSNITFTPENDTLTAMAFIAGNLLNKLWNMDKDSSESFESDSLKHQKINDLLELFKEPLNARQELFLKNALEKLSHSLNKNKNVRNITICETLETDDLENNSSNNIFDVYKKCNKSTTSKSTENNFNKPKKTDLKTTDHSDVAEKLTDVLNLIKKFENTQRKLNSLREKVDSASKQSSDENLSDNNNNKFNLFGKVLEKVTKLLLPYRHSKRMINKINKLNQLKDQQQLKGQLFRSLSISAKDKIILDFLNHIKNNPNCLLSKLAANPEVFEENLVGIKGNVIESITKLLSGKSLVDIEKLIIPQKTISTSTTIQPTSTKSLQQLRKSKELEPVKLASAKERLKTHLQSIIYDLAELQNERGNHGTEINITDILPCISHLIGDNNKNKESLEMSPNKKDDGLPIDNIEKLIDALQIELRSNSFTRRSDLGERPTSARVWERILKNMDFKRNKTRRFQIDKFKSYSDLKRTIENIEKRSGTYKNYALLSVIPAYKKRMLLKTLQADVTRHSNVLTEIQSSFSSLEQISSENLKDIVEFIDNTATNINLSNNVLINLNKTNNKMAKPLPQLLELKSERTPHIQNNYIKQQTNRNLKLTREQIMNQLMLNRIQLYLKMKEEDGLNENDINYNIGKRALVALRNGNSRLAKELYQILVESKLVRNVPQTRRMGRRKLKNENTKGAILNALKEPLLKIGGKGFQVDSEDIIFTK